MTRAYRIGQTMVLSSLSYSVIAFASLFDPDLALRAAARGMARHLAYRCERNFLVSVFPKPLAS